MALLPAASTTLSESNNAQAIGEQYLVVIAPVAQSADYTPRVFSSTQALLSQYLYCQGVDYCAMHFEETDMPVLFVGVPVVTAGTVGSVNNTGVTGTSQITFAAASTGIMEECQGSLTIASGGTVGTSQIVGTLSLDGGLSNQTIRFGTATTYTVPYVGLVITLGGGTLNAGDTVTFQTTAPMWGSTALSTVQTNLAAQQLGSRSWLVIGQVPTATFAGYVVTAINAYETADERFNYARVATPAFNPLAVKSQQNVAMTAATELVFAASGHTITRTGGSFVTDGFAIGDVVTVSGSTGNNGVIGALTNVSTTVLTFGSGVVNETETPVTASIIASDGITFAASGQTATRSAGRGSFVTDGFVAGQTVNIGGTTGNNINGAVLSTVSATVLTFVSGSGITNEGPDADASVTIAQMQTVAGWANTNASNFASVAAQKRVSLSMGRGFKQSPITGYNFRRPACWAASLREYQHDYQIPTYRKSDGPLDGWSLTNAAGSIVEYDERIYGVGVAQLFTTMRSWANGPAGAFIALDLTRDTDGAVLSRTQNIAVADLFQQVVQTATEGLIGTVLPLQDNGTLTPASLSLLEKIVNKALQINLLQNFSEGPRASDATWTPSATDNLSIPGATLHGVGNLVLDGTLEQIATATQVS